MNELDALERVQEALAENKHIKLKPDATPIKIVREVLKNYDFRDGKWIMKGTKSEYSGPDAAIVFNSARLGNLLDSSPGSYNPKHIVDWSNEKTTRAKKYTADTLQKYIEKKGIVFKDSIYGRKDIQDFVISKIQANGYFADKDDSGQLVLRKLSNGYWSEQVPVDTIFAMASQGMVDNTLTDLKQKEKNADLYARAKRMAEAPVFDQHSEQNTGTPRRQTGNPDEIYKVLLETESQVKVLKKINGVPDRGEVLRDLENEWLAKKNVYDQSMLSLNERMAFQSEPKQRMDAIFGTHKITIDKESQRYEDILKKCDQTGEDY
jgi:hypothetical protein